MRRFVTLTSGPTLSSTCARANLRSTWPHARAHIIHKRFERCFICSWMEYYRSPVSVPRVALALSQHMTCCHWVAIVTSPQQSARTPDTQKSHRNRKFETGRRALAACYGWWDAATHEPCVECTMCCTNMNERQNMYNHCRSSAHSEPRNASPHTPCTTPYTPQARL
jgi:hypothetical protein